MRFSLLGLFLALGVLSAQPTPSTRGLVISQIYGGGGNSGAIFRTDYVELYNRGAAPVTLTGKTLQYASATGTGLFGANAPVALTGTLEPGRYYLVALASGGATGAVLPTPDATGTVDLSATTGKVALVNSPAGLDCNGGATPCTAEQTALILDLVGYGTANYYLGSAAAPAGSNTTALLRKDDGKTDTGDNRNDFTAGRPAPRNNGGLTLVSPVTLPAAILGAPYSQTFTASGGSGSYSWSVVEGALPTWLTLTMVRNNAVLAGTPATTAGAPFSFTIQVVDASGAGAPATRVYTLAVNGAVGSCDSPTPLSAIQGSGPRSPLAGQTVVTGGVVTAIKTGTSGGYFLQDSTHGLFVFTGSTVPEGVAPGNAVCVVGPVIEFVPASDPSSASLTEITTPNSAFPLARRAELPAPVTLTSVEMANLERYEGMRVTAPLLTVVQPTGGSINETNASSASNGVFYAVLTGLPRPFRGPGVAVNDPLPASAPCCIPRWDENPTRLRIDSDAQPNAVALEAAAGSTVAGVTGVLDYAFRTYTILPDASPAPLVVSGPVAPTPVPTPALNEAAIATYNLQRFYDDANDPATSDAVLSPAALQNRLRKASLLIRTVLRSPDILAVEEVENLATLQALADRIAADAGPVYTPYLWPGNDPGGINVGFLVKAGPRVQVIDIAQLGKDATYTNPNRDRLETTNDRPPLVLRVLVGATPITIIANHLRSLTDSDNPTAEGTGTVGDRIRAKRRAQAEFLANLIQQRQQADPTERIVVVGDFNAFAQNDGYVDVVGTITGKPAPANQVLLASADLVNPDLTNMLDTLRPAERYSYLFDGSAQTLDHILLNAPAMQIFTRGAYARVNADFPESLRADASRPERLSDHDPAVAYLRITADVTGELRVANQGALYLRGSRLWSGAVTITNPGTAAVSGPLQLVLQNLPAGVTVANADGTWNGQPYLTIPGELAPGASATVNVLFQNPSFAAIQFTARVFSGPLQ